MYSPKYAIQTDRKIINGVIQDNPFATLVYVEDGEPQSFHLPLILEENKLIGHLALANPAWEAIADSSILVIFHGPHCYISPTWYGTPNNVPTWNYISIHVRGKVTIHRDEVFLRKALTILGEAYDSVNKMPQNIDDNQRLLSSIVGIEISMDSVFGKFKLAQSKPIPERQNVIDVLSKSPKEMDRHVAMAMKETSA